VGPRDGLDVSVGKKILLAVTGVRAAEDWFSSLVALPATISWLPAYELRQNYVLRTHKHDIVTEQVASRCGRSD
jgi:hypothetical protein